MARKPHPNIYVAHASGAILAVRKTIRAALNVAREAADEQPGSLVYLLEGPSHESLDSVCSIGGHREVWWVG